MFHPGGIAWNNLMRFSSADLLAFYGRCRISRTISLATVGWVQPRWGPSHVGMICDYQGPEHQGPLLIESTTLNTLPCRIQGCFVRGVQAHDPVERIRTYQGRVELYRAVPIWALDDRESRLLTWILMEHFVRAGVTYDRGGALLSGTRAFKWTRWFPDAALERVFCSELIAALLMRLGRMAVQNPALYTPAALVRELVRTGVYRRLDPATDGA